MPTPKQLRLDDSPIATSTTLDSFPTDLRPTSIPQSLYASLSLLSTLQPELRQLILQQLQLYISIRQQYNLAMLFPTHQYQSPSHKKQISSTMLTVPPQLLPYHFLSSQYAKIDTKSLLKSFPYQFYNQLKDNLLDQFQSGLTSRFPQGLPTITRWIYIQQWVWSSSYHYKPRLQRPLLHIKSFTQVLFDKLSIAQLNVLFSLFESTNSHTMSLYNHIPTFSTLFNSVFMKRIQYEKEQRHYQQQQQRIAADLKNMNGDDDIANGQNNDDTKKQDPDGDKTKAKQFTPSSTNPSIPPTNKSHQSSAYYTTPPQPLSDKLPILLQSTLSLQNNQEESSFVFTDKVKRMAKAAATHTTTNAATAKIPQTTMEIRRQMLESIKSIDTNAKKTVGQVIEAKQHCAMLKLRKTYQRCVDQFLTGLLVTLTKVLEIIAHWYDVVYLQQFMLLIDHVVDKTNLCTRQQVEKVQMHDDEDVGEEHVNEDEHHPDDYIYLSDDESDENDESNCYNNINFGELDSLHQQGLLLLLKTIPNETFNPLYPTQGRLLQSQFNIDQQSQQHPKSKQESLPKFFQNDVDIYNYNQGLPVSLEYIQQHPDLYPHLLFNLDSVPFLQTALQCFTCLSNNCTCPSLYQADDLFDKDETHVDISSGDQFQICSTTVLDEIELYCLTGAITPPPHNNNNNNSQYNPSIADKLTIFPIFPSYRATVDEIAFHNDYLQPPPLTGVVSMTNTAKGNQHKKTQRATQTNSMDQLSSSTASNTATRSKLTLQMLVWLRQLMLYTPQNPQLTTIYQHLHQDFTYIQKQVVLVAGKLTKHGKIGPPTSKDQLVTVSTFPQDTLLLSPPPLITAQHVYPLFQNNQFQPQLALYHNNSYFEHITKSHQRIINHYYSHPQLPPINAPIYKQSCPIVYFSKIQTQVMNTFVSKNDSQLTKLYQNLFNLEWLGQLPDNYQEEHRNSLEGVKKHSTLTDQTTKSGTNQFKAITEHHLDLFDRMLITDSSGQTVEISEMIYPPSLPPPTPFELLDLVQCNIHLPDYSQYKRTQFHFKTYLQQLMSQKPSNGVKFAYCALQFITDRLSDVLVRHHNDISMATTTTAGKLYLGLDKLLLGLLQECGLGDFLPTANIAISTNKRFGANVSTLIDVLRDTLNNPQEITNNVTQNGVGDLTPSLMVKKKAGGHNLDQMTVAPLLPQIYNAGPYYIGIISGHGLELPKFPTGMVQNTEQISRQCHRIEQLVAEASKYNPTRRTPPLAAQNNFLTPTPTAAVMPYAESVSTTPIRTRKKKAQMVDDDNQTCDGSARVGNRTKMTQSTKSTKMGAENSHTITSIAPKSTTTTAKPSSMDDIDIGDYDDDGNLVVDLDNSVDLAVDRSKRVKTDLPAKQQLQLDELVQLSQLQNYTNDIAIPSNDVLTMDQLFEDYDDNNENANSDDNNDLDRNRSKNDEIGDVHDQGHQFSISDDSCDEIDNQDHNDDVLDFNIGLTRSPSKQILTNTKSNSHIDELASLRATTQQQQQQREIDLPSTALQLPKLPPKRLTQLALADGDYDFDKTDVTPTNVLLHQQHQISSHGQNHDVKEIVTPTIPAPIELMSPSITTRSTKKQIPAEYYIKPKHHLTPFCKSMLHTNQCSKSNCQLSHQLADYPCLAFFKIPTPVYFTSDLPLAAASFTVYNPNPVLFNYAKTIIANPSITLATLGIDSIENGPCQYGNEHNGHQCPFSHEQIDLFEWKLEVLHYAWLDYKLSSEVESQKGGSKLKEISAQKRAFKRQFLTAEQTVWKLALASKSRANEATPATLGQNAANPKATSSNTTINLCDDEATPTALTNLGDNNANNENNNSRKFIHTNLVQDDLFSGVESTISIVRSPQWSQQNPPPQASTRVQPKLR